MSKTHLCCLQTVQQGVAISQSWDENTQQGMLSCPYYFAITTATTATAAAAPAAVTTTTTTTAF